MQTLTAWHRWLCATGDSRSTGGLITGTSSIAFLFLLISGAYLWLPKVFRWSVFNRRLILSRTYGSTRVRDFFWHHVFAAWSFVPLLVILLTGVVIAFPWAQSALAKIAGDGPGRAPTPQAVNAPQDSQPLSLDELLLRVMTNSEAWRSVSIEIPEPESSVVAFQIDVGSGRQPHKRRTLMLDAYSGAVVGASGFEDLPPTRRATAWNRFLHTGESFGVIGQTIAGMSSLAALFIVWTGLALAWRRLIPPLFAKN